MSQSAISLWEKEKIKQTLRISKDDWFTLTNVLKQDKHTIYFNIDFKISAIYQTHVNGLFCSRIINAFNSFFRRQELKQNLVS